MTHAEPEPTPTDFQHGGTPSTPEEIRLDIEEARADLAHTVDALTQKLDVKARASEKAKEVSAQLEPHRQQIVAGGGAVLALLLLVRLRRARKNRKR